ncbi:MAG: hypothetical protein COV67_09335 [Nitrospinae bacterium CG11_big_fil_rev_8_21_14_0_20_56_8]|nr:MAG: hypothetical protein COV67_09335 [Nitrospinae bacterium CG11_big_fil_rev_8_21_14_0_20_56_8]
MNLIRRKTVPPPAEVKGSAVKSLLMILVLGFAGVGVYYSGKQALRFFDPSKKEAVAHPVKKTAAVKPRSLVEKRVKVEPLPPLPNYSFYETLNDTTLSKYVGLNGKLTSSPPAGKWVPASAPATGQIAETVPLKPVKTSPVDQRVKSTEGGGMLAELDSVEGIGFPFWVQVSSFRELPRAQEMAARLKKKGYPAFTRSIEVSEKGIWYRVYLGRYSDSEAAESVARRAREEEKLDAVVLHRPDEIFASSEVQ